MCYGVDVDRYLRTILIICTLCIAAIIFTSFESIEFWWIFIISTGLFLPTAVVMYTFRYKLASLPNNNNVGVYAIFGLLIGYALTAHLSLYARFYVSIYGYEVLFMYYIIYNKYSQNKC